MKADKKYFYKNLKYLREISKTSQQQLADYLKVDRSTISRWENNEMDATIGYAIDISTYFDIPINYLLCYDIQNEEIYCYPYGSCDDALRRLNKG